MEIENAVRCMRHCSSDWNIFYVNFPVSCPICGGKLKGSFLVVPPFCVPHPFVSSSAVPFSVVVKPTDGCFLDTYQNGHDLHIGITTSSGLVYNYDELGVHIDENTAWSLCASLNLSNIVDSRNYGSWKLIVQNWDDKLKIHSQKPDWSHRRYDAFSHNCYNFVLSFLRILLPERLNFQDKEIFCKDYIVPLTTRVAQYIDLRRKVLCKGAIVMKATPT